MKTIGIIGGLSWESTQYYYQFMNKYVHEKLGGLNSINAIIYSINFGRIEEALKQDDWKFIASVIVDAAIKIEGAGAEFLIMTSNAVHKVADEVQAAVKIPLLHIADPTIKAIKKTKIKKVGLLGTKVTMEEAFWKERLEGIEVVVPGPEDRELIHKVIFEELVSGKINPASKIALQNIIKKLDVQGVILGCTELNLILHQKDSSVMLFDTTALHATAAVEAALW